MAQIKTSECTVCHEQLVQTGNYSFKILPAKRAPKKAIKMNLSHDNSMWGLDKFQKYLLKHSVSKNYCELKCGNCGTVCTFPLDKSSKKKKQDKSLLSTNPSFSTTPTLDSSMTKKRKKKKTSKDMNAGLLIPDSFRPSPYSSPASCSGLPSTSSDKSKFPPLKKPKLQQNTPLSRSTVKNFQKVLFKSKRDGGGSSLGDMLK